MEHKQGPGGRSAVIKGSRVRVSDIARMYDMFHEELIVERIQAALPHLTLEQVRDEITYWRQNRDEIAEDRALAAAD